MRQETKLCCAVTLDLSFFPCNMSQWDVMETYDGSYYWRRKSGWCSGLTARRPILHFGPRELALGLRRLPHFSELFLHFPKWKAGTSRTSLCSSGDFLLPFFILLEKSSFWVLTVFQWPERFRAAGFWSQLCLSSSLGFTTLSNMAVGRYLASLCLCFLIHGDHDDVFS